LVDALDSKSSFYGSAGSTPAGGTIPVAGSRRAFAFALPGDSGAALSLPAAIVSASSAILAPVAAAMWQRLLRNLAVAGSSFTILSAC